MVAVPISHLPLSPNPSLQVCFQTLNDKTCTDYWSLPQPQCRTSHFALFEIHGVHVGALLKPVQVSLDGSPSLQSVHHTFQLGVICKPAVGALSATACVINKGINSIGPSTDP